MEIVKFQFKLQSVEYVIFGLSLLSLVANLLLFNYQITNKKEIIEVQNNDFIEYKEIQDVMYDVIISHNYSSDYNCVNFSKDTVLKLSEKNIQSFLISSVPKTNETNRSNHMYIAIAFEPQNGKLVNISEYEPYKITLYDNNESENTFKEIYIK